MERYYDLFDGPKFNKFRKQLIPFAIKFYKGVTTDDILFINDASCYLKAFYSSTYICVIFA